MVEMILESGGILHSCPKGIYYHVSYLLYIPIHHAHLILKDGGLHSGKSEGMCHLDSFGGPFHQSGFLVFFCLRLGSSVSFRHLLGCESEVFALDNGLALTPPMGWMTWQRYRCETDCSGPGAKRCINEDLIKEMADRLAEATGCVGLFIL